MSITFDVNKKALQSMGENSMTTNTVMAVFNGRISGIVEAAGANYDKLIGSFVEPASLDAINDLAPEARKKYEKYVRPSSSFSHALIEAAHTSFAYHYPLILTPDSIWLTIAQGFANHVNQNAEELRHQFVAHDGKKLIIIDRPQFVKGNPNNDWQGCFNEFSDKIGNYIGKRRELLVSNFSTTGFVEKAVSDLVLMDSMKSYFKYGVRTLCGIPNITLTGSVEDWKNIRTRTENLSEFNLDWWTKSLVPVLDELVKTAEGNPDIKFWDSFFKKEGGSGGPYINGWINELFPYTVNYKKELSRNSSLDSWNSNRGHGLTTDSYPNSLSKVPFKWQYYATVHDMEFLGGLIGVHQDESTLAVEPVVGWAVKDQGTSKEGEIDPNEDW